MPFKFTHICDLLQSLEDIECRDPPYISDRKRAKVRLAVEDWFRKHRNTLDQPDTDDVAILSILLPQRRADRVYNIQEKRLQILIARCLSLTCIRAKELDGWKTPGNGDLGACLERLDRVHDAEPLPGPGAMTVGEVDAALRDLASQCRYSGPEVRKQVSYQDREALFSPLFRRLHSRDKKWLTRLLLKGFGTIVLDEGLVLREFHFMLPSLLRFQDDFAAAIALLRGPLKHYRTLPKPDPLSQRALLQDAAQHLRPQIGVKVGRPTWYKARSMINCLQMLGRGTWIIERKYDGEFCEIHIDLTKGDEWIRIFSKNGKDATQDRKKLHATIRKCLKIGNPGCKFNTKCILLGEMVVYSDLEHNVLEFDKIRKHVSRSGSFLGTDKDSQPHPYEHLMICLFDVLLIDEEVTMAKPHWDRRESLAKLVTKIEGRAMTVERKKLDFSDPDARKSLVIQFAAALSSRCEGLILKPNGPYFSLARDETGSWCKGFIKLKKDCMVDMGGERDVADFAMVGASYEARQAQKCGLPHVRWTNFYLGCRVDDEKVSFHARPKFRVVAVIKQDQCIPPKELKFLNQLGQFHCRDYDPDEPLGQFDVQLGRNPAPAVLFTSPFVVEVLGSAFEKPGNEDFYMLRHPRILKTHTDRSWEDCITMRGLAEMAEEARNAPAAGESQEAKDYMEKLWAKAERAYERRSQDSRQTTQRSATTASTASPSSVLRRTLPRSNAADTPSPLSALKEGRRSLGAPSPLDVSAGIGLLKEATPLSEQSTQWTDTVASPALSGKGARKPLSAISPPKKNWTVNRAAPKLQRPSPNVQPRRTRAEHAPGPGKQDERPFEKPKLHGTENAPGSRISPAPVEAVTTNRPLTSAVVRVDTPELLPGERREFLSVEQRSKIECAANAQRRHKAVPDIRASVRPQPPRQFTTSTTARNPRPSPARVDSMNVLSVQRKDALDVIERAGLKSPETRPASTNLMAMRSLTAATISTAQVLPPINGFALPTPPTSSPNEPASVKPTRPAINPLPTPPMSTPNAPQAGNSPTSTPRPSTSREGTVALSSTIRPSTPKASAAPTSSTTATRPTFAPNPRKRSADDFDIGMTPRRTCKWRSSVYGLPSLPPSLPVQSTPPPPPTPQPPSQPQPPLLAPYNLFHTVVYLAPSIQSHAPLRSSLTTHFSSTLVPDLAHWARDPTAYEPMGDTVGESQAYAGYRKLVLVEPQRAAEARRVMERVGRLGLKAEPGTRRSVVEAYDWRVVADLVEWAEGEGGMAVDGDEGGEGREEGEMRVWERRFWGRV